MAETPTYYVYEWDSEWVPVRNEKREPTQFTLETAKECASYYGCTPDMLWAYGPQVQPGHKPIIERIYCDHDEFVRTAE